MKYVTGLIERDAFEQNACCNFFIGVSLPHQSVAAHTVLKADDESVLFNWPVHLTGNAIKLISLVKDERNVEFWKLGNITRRQNIERSAAFIEADEVNAMLIDLS